MSFEPPFPTFRSISRDNGTNKTTVNDSEALAPSKEAKRNRFSQYRIIQKITSYFSSGKSPEQESQFDELPKQEAPKREWTWGKAQKNRRSTISTTDDDMSPRGINFTTNTGNDQIVKSFEKEFRFADRENLEKTWKFNYSSSDSPSFTSSNLHTITRNKSCKLFLKNSVKSLPAFRPSISDIDDAVNKAIRSIYISLERQTNLNEEGQEERQLFRSEVESVLENARYQVRIGLVSWLQ